jgi:hypothetical protein
MLSKVGRYMSNSKVAYVYTQRHESQGGDDELSEYDHLTRYFEQAQDIAYTVLWDACPTPDPACTTADAISTPTTGGSSGGIVASSPSSCLLSHTKFDSQHSCTKDHSNDDTMMGLRQEGLLCRRNLQLGSDTKVFLAIAWVFKPELRYFKLFPEVMHVDGTSHSTRKKYELITFSVKSSLGRQVVFLRVWLPDQKRYSFRWIFQHVLLGLIPRECFQRTRLVMGDAGDRQQQAEIELAIKEYMPNARFGGCGWHIVDRGWRRNGPTSNSFTGYQRKQEAQALFRGVRSWIYSWMKPGYCESREEYLVSLRLLKNYISSPAVSKVLEGRKDVIDHVKKFLRENIVVYDNHYLHFLRRDTRFFDISHNSCHEGTNHGLKSSASAVLPGHNPVKAAECMVMQAEMTTKKLDDLSSKLLHETKTWSKLPTAPYLVTVAESILSQQVLRYKQYCVVHFGHGKCEVDFIPTTQNRTAAGAEQEESAHPEEQEEDSFLLFPSAEEDEADDVVMVDREDSHSSSRAFPPIPLFTRTRTVTWYVEEEEDSRFTFRCSCCQFERIGIPCVHIYSVAKALDPKWNGFTHHHVAVRWWTTYICYGFREDNTNNSPMTGSLNALAQCDIEAPSISLTPLPGLNVQKPDSGTTSAHLPAFLRVKNYPQEELLQIFGEANKKNKKRTTEEDLLDIGLTQTTYDPDNNSEGCSGCDSGDEFDDDSEEAAVDVGGGCNKNLFQESCTRSLGQSDDENIREFDGVMRAITSLYRMVGKPDRDSASAALAALHSQLRGAVSKRMKGTGTQGIVVESHPKRSRRAYNTHQPYYR